MSWEDFEDECSDALLNFGSRCSVSVMLRHLPDDDARASVVRALENDNLTASSIARVLVSRQVQHAPSAYSIRHHRRGDCSCGKG